MKIADVRVHLIDLEGNYSLPMFGIFKGEAGFVRVFTDEGIEGNSDFFTHALPSKLLGEQIAAIKQYIVGEDPFNTERIWCRIFNTTRSVLSIYALGCINVALWDILGKALNIPIYRLLGGFRERIRAYASTQCCENIDSFVKLIKSLVDQGFTAIKFHSWSDPERDIKLSRSIREAVGEGIDLMIDPMGLYDRRGALKVGSVLDELKFYWYEEPMPEEDVEGYIELCQRLDVPIVGFDSLRLSFGNYANYISKGALDIVQADPGRQGISWNKKVAGIAEGFGRKFQAHAFGTPLSQAASLHLMCGISNGDLFEVQVPQWPFKDAVKNSIALDGDGYVNVPQTPGLGLEIDWEIIDTITTVVIS